MTRRAGIYGRISPTPGEGAGWERQVADCHELAAARGWEVVDEYVDKGKSAYQRRRRPEWERLMRDLASGHVDALIVWHPDRAYRRGNALETLVDLVEAKNIQIATVKAGDLDLTTATGRMAARIVAAVTQHESEHMAERVSRERQQRAIQGKAPAGGVRAFGWKRDKLSLEPREARALRNAAERVAAGGSVGREAKRLNDAGFTTTGDRPWDTGSLTRVLRSPRLAGLSSYKGEIVGDAVWPPIVDRKTWDRLRVMTEGRRIGPRTAPRSLLSALITCPKCDRPLYLSHGGTRSGPAYVCAPGTRQGCGGSSIRVTHADRAVIDAVDRWLNDPTIAWGRRPNRNLHAAGEADRLEAKRLDLAARWAADELTDLEYEHARKVIVDRLAELDDPTPPPPRWDRAELLAAWRDGTTEDRRAVIEAVVERINLAPSRVADPADRITVRFHD